MLWVTRRNTETDHKRAVDALALNGVLELVTSLLDVYHSSDQLYCAWQHLHLTQTGGWYWISVWPLMRNNRYFIVKWSEVKREWPINLLPHLCQNISHYSISTYLLLWLQTICNSRFFFIHPSPLLQKLKWTLFPDEAIPRCCSAQIGHHSIIQH